MLQQICSESGHRGIKIRIEDPKNKTRVSMISPGFVDTPLLDNYFKGSEEKLSELVSKTRNAKTRGCCKFSHSYT